MARPKKTTVNEDGSPKMAPEDIKAALVEIAGAEPLEAGEMMFALSERSGRLLGELRKQLQEMKRAGQRAQIEEDAAETRRLLDEGDEVLAAAEVDVGGRLNAAPPASGRKAIIVTTPADTLDQRGVDVARLMGQRGKVYAFGGRPVLVVDGDDTVARVYVRDARGRKVVGEDGEPVTVPAKTVRVIPMSDHQLFTQATSVARYAGMNEMTGEWNENIVCPPALLKTIKAALEVGAGLPTLRAVSSRPVWWGGRLIWGEGYHQPSGVYLQTGDLKIERWDDAGAAMDFLLGDWLGDFALAGAKDDAIALAIAATMLMRPTTLIDELVPLFLVSASASGIGKSFLIEVIHMAVFGASVPTMHYGDSEEERAKQVASLVMGSRSVAFFDNLANGMRLGRGHETLTTLATEKVFRGRILGGNTMHEGPTGLVTILTGNNVVVADDMARRVIECRMLHDGETNLLRREFRHRDLVGWTKENRGRILGALECILRHKPARRAGAKSIAESSSFAAWARLVAAPIIDLQRDVGLTEEDFYEVWEVAAEEAEEGMSAAPGIDTVVAAIGSLEVTSDDGKWSARGVDGDWFSAAELAQHLPSHVWRNTWLKDDANEKAISSFLRGHADQTFNGAKLRVAQMALSHRRTGGKKRHVFRIQPLSADYDPQKAMAETKGGREAARSEKVVSMLSRLKPTGE